METPRSPPATEAGEVEEQADIVMGGTEEAEAPPSRPFDSHPRELVPEKLLQAYPNGNPSVEGRSPEQQAPFEQRKNEIMRKMTLPEMQSKYKDIAGQITERLEDNEKKTQEWEAERDKVVQNHETEAKALKRMLSALQDE